MISAVQALLLTAHIFIRNTYILSIQAGLILISFVSFCVTMKMKYPFKVPAFIILCLANIVALIGLWIQLENLSAVDVYFQMFIIGVGQQMSIILFLHFKYRLMSGLLMLALHLLFFSRLALIRDRETSVGAGVPILMNVVFICATFLKEINERTVFQKFFKYKGDDSKQILESLYTSRVC